MDEAATSEETARSLTIATPPPPLPSSPPCSLTCALVPTTQSPQTPPPQDSPQENREVDVSALTLAQPPPSKRLHYSTPPTQHAPPSTPRAPVRSITLLPPSPWPPKAPTHHTHPQNQIHPLISLSTPCLSFYHRCPHTRRTCPSKLNRISSTKTLPHLYTSTLPLVRPPQNPLLPRLPSPLNLSAIDQGTSPDNPISKTNTTTS